MMDTVLSFAGENNKWNTAEDAEPVAKAIRDHKKLLTLNLEGNTMGVEAAKLIGDALATHPEIERAHWKDMFTGRLKTEIPEALKNLFSGLLRAKAKLIELDLSDNALGPIGVEGMVQFMPSQVCYSLQELRLNNNGLGIKGGKMLCKSLTELLNNAKKHGTPWKLKTFISGRNRLENDGAMVFAELFASLGTLETVAMPQNGIFHAGITALANAFSQNKGLKTINLNDNTFTPKGAGSMAQELPSLPLLEVINFGDCLLKTKGAIAIAEALSKGVPNLKELYLDSNEIRYAGGISVVEALKGKSQLTTLMLDANQFGVIGLEDLLSKAIEVGCNDAMCSLEDNEEADTEEEKEEESEEEEEEEVDVDEEEDENDEWEDIEVISKPQKEITPLPKGNKNPTGLTPVKCNAQEFLSEPTAQRILGLSIDVAALPAEIAKTTLAALQQQQQLDEFSRKIEFEEIFVNSCFLSFMRTAALSLSQNKTVTELALKITSEFAKAAFMEAEKNNRMSLATNSLLMHLDLIKSENKNFRIDWPLDGCLIALSHCVDESFFPSETKRALQFFISKPNPKLDTYEKVKHKLLASLYKF